MTTKTTAHVPVGGPQLGQREIEYVTAALEAGAISGTNGPFLERFEREFSSYCGCSHGVATCNGTAALHLALAAIGIGPGDEVLVSTLTNMATFFAVLYLGATPIPVDIEPDTLNLNPALLDGLVTRQTRAILVVHLYGHPADIDPIAEFAGRHGLYLIEDAAEAHGAQYKGRMVGSLGHISCFSFYANKIVTTGEGGMLVSSDRDLAEHARSLRSLAYGHKQRFMHAEIGFNYRMTNLQAALGCAQLEKIEKIIDAKRRVARMYAEHLSALEAIQLPVEKPYARNVYWMYHVVLKEQFRESRDLVMERLRDHGIETRATFIPYNLQERFIRDGLTRPDLCPVANQISGSGFYLPSFADLSEEEIRYVASHLRDVLEQMKSLPFSPPDLSERASQTRGSKE